MPVVDGMRTRKRVAVDVGGVSRTEQHHANEVNINTIMRKALKTGFIAQKSGGVYGDFSNVKSYHEALTAVRDSQVAFMKLPALLRRRFENDPGKLLAFLDDESNRDEAVELGLVEKVDSGGSEVVSEPAESPVEPVAEPPAV